MYYHDYNGCCTINIYILLSLLLIIHNSYSHFKPHFKVRIAGQSSPRHVHRHFGRSALPSREPHGATAGDQIKVFKKVLEGENERM